MLCARQVVANFDDEGMLHTVNADQTPEEVLRATRVTI